MYLGLSGNGNFKISQIEAKAVIINLFNLYCPSCQGMVQEMAKLYHRIENNPDLKNRVKLMGIGIGNSLHEVKVFTETYQLPFPIFPDEDFKIHKLFGEVRTPYLIGIEIDKNDRHRIVYTQRGGITEAESFLHLILEVYGFKQEDPPLRREDLSITLIN